MISFGQRTYETYEENVEAVALNLTEVLCDHKVNDLACENGQDDIRYTRAQHKQHRQANTAPMVHQILQNLSKRLLLILSLLTLFFLGT